MYPHLRNDHEPGKETFRYTAWVLDDDTVAVEEGDLLIIVTKEDLLFQFTEGGSWHSKTTG